MSSFWFAVCAGLFVALLWVDSCYFGLLTCGIYVCCIGVVY